MKLANKIPSTGRSRFVVKAIKRPPSIALRRTGRQPLGRKKIPLRPGVYRFLDKRGRVLYVGRANALRRRVLQYFQKNLAPHTEEMVSLARDLKFQVTDTILDSIVLEANLIKKYWPKYNVREKDDKSFIYIVIPQAEFTYPKLVRAHELKKFSPAKARIFGPYNSQSLAANALKIIRRIFPYSTCRPYQGHPCFDWQIGLCPGICIGQISARDYLANIKNIILLLGGHKKRLLKKLSKDNPLQAKALQHIQDVTLLSNDDLALGGLNRIEGYDISHLSGRETYGSMVVFKQGQPDKSQYRLFKIKTAPAHDDLRALAEVLSRRLKHQEWPRPDMIMIDGGKPQIDFVRAELSKQNINIPLVGISKYAGDKLVYPAGVKKSIKDLAQMNRNILLQVRDEAHRFGLKASRRKRQIR